MMTLWLPKVLGLVRILVSGIGATLVLTGVLQLAVMVGMVAVSRVVVSS